MFEIIFIGFFFTLCNYCIGSFVVLTFTRLFREGCGGYVCILLWPHWIFCLFFPFMIGMSNYNIWAGFALLIVTGIMPYTYWAIRFNRRPDTGGSERMMPCCSCICQKLHKKNLEDSIICKKVVEEDPALGIVPRPIEDNDGTIISFRTRHPKSDLMLKKKKKEKKKKKSENIQSGDGSTTGSIQRHKKRKPYCKVHDEESLFPVSLPSEDMNENESIGDAVLDGESLQKSTDTSASEQFCNICLEEYKIGEDIGWSKNDLCHHVFHKHCILEWLVQHQDCPICRNKY